MRDSAQAGGMIVDFERDPGILHVRFAPACSVRGEHALDLIREIDARVPPPRPLRVLVDATHSEGLSLVARLEFVDWVRRHRARYRAAVHSVPRSMEGIAANLAALLPVPFRLFDDPRAARAWLAANAAPEIAASASAPAAPPATPRRVLVVDDSGLVVRQLSRILEQALPGVEVRASADGGRAEALLRETEADVLFLDLQLADGENGLSLLRRLDAQARDIHVITMSGHPMRHPDVAAARALGAMSHLEKPLRREAVEAALSAFGRTGAAPGAAAPAGAGGPPLSRPA